MTTTALKTFAANVKEACEATPGAGKFGTKTFIHTALAIGTTAGLIDLSRSEFEASLWAAHRAGLLTLSRLDLVEAASRYE